MKYVLVLVSFALVSCSQATKTKPASTYSGIVFNELRLPTPNAIRTGSGAPGEAYWQQQVDHSIQVTLDVDSNEILGSEIITYHNNSPDTLTYIWLQLEQNAHQKESIRSREGRVENDPSYKGIDISLLEVDGKPVIWKEYATLAKLLLNKPLKPHQKISIAIDWSFKMPLKTSMRMGYDDSYKLGPVWELAQWFPAPCVYDDVYGWNTLPYIGRGEFYTNFGNYSVDITVPSNHVVFASGNLRNPADVLTLIEHERYVESWDSDEVITIRTEDELSSESDGMQTWSFTGELIRTFAWATSASFIWESASVEIDGLQGNPNRVLCQVGYPSEESDIWNEAVSYLQHSIKYYSKTLYPYPWSQMSMTRGKAGGMEYPMLVFCRGSSHESLFNVTDHEVGHSWFPMIINTDERRHAWMDEGFNTFVNHYSLEDFYGNRAHKPDVSTYKAEKFKDDAKPINTPPDLLQSRGHLSYRKPGYGMRFLREEIMGEERFDSAWNDYVFRWAFKSPRPADFYRTMEDSSGMDLQWFFKGFFEQTLQLDQGIVDVQIKQGKNETWDVTVQLENFSDWVCPVYLQIICIDGSVHDFLLPVTVWAWSRQHAQTFTLPTKIQSVVIDPENAYPDINRCNNALFFNPN